MFGFEAELGRKSRIPAMNPRNVVRQNRPVAAVMNWSREGQDLNQTREVSRCRTAKSANNSITRGRGVAFHAIDFANAVREFAGSEEKISETATQFARRTIISSGRILNVGHSSGGNGQRNKHYEELLFHGGIESPKQLLCFKATAKLSDVDAISDEKLIRSPTSQCQNPRFGAN